MKGCQQLLWCASWKDTQGQHSRSATTTHPRAARCVRSALLGIVKCSATLLTQGSFWKRQGVHLPELFYQINQKKTCMHMLGYITHTHTQYYSFHRTGLRALQQCYLLLQRPILILNIFKNARWLYPNGLFSPLIKKKKICRSNPAYRLSFPLLFKMPTLTT